MTLPSLNQRIRADIEAKILSGQWPPGHRIPFEHELMAHYGCARMTVNKVLSSLVEAGLIERRRRAGSFVRRPLDQSAVLEIPDIKAQVVARGGIYGYALLNSVCRSASAEEQRIYDIPASSQVRLLECRHLAGDQPFALERRLIALDAIPAAAEADFTHEPPGSWLLDHVPWHEAEHKITARAADPAIAEQLAIEPGTACLVIERRTWQSGAVLTAVRLWYPGDHYELIARFTPSGGGGRG